MNGKVYTLSVATLHYFDKLLANKELDKDLYLIIEEFYKVIKEEVDSFYANSIHKKIKVFDFEPSNLTDSELIKMTYLKLKIFEGSYLGENKIKLTNLIEYINKCLKEDMFKNRKGR